MNPTISIIGQDFVLAIPGSHTIRIPLGEPAKLVAILQARRNGSLRIAEPGSPTQWQVDRATERAAQEIFLSDRRATALSELGL